MIALRNLDLVILAVALVVFLVAGLPIGGWLTAAGIWAMWRGIGWFSDRKAAAATDPKQVVGIATGSMRRSVRSPRRRGTLRAPRLRLTLLRS